MNHSSDKYEVRRVIAQHDASGTAQLIDQVLPCVPLGPNGSRMALLWVTDKTPADNMDARDLAQSFAGIIPDGGTALRIIDISPSETTAMHRTLSIDYVMITKGSIDLELEGGATRTLHRGDIVVQRGTNHRWVNRSGEWAQMLAIPISAMPVMIDGRPLDEIHF
jgi:quercetin dioxygenase-like cupin family protein